MPQHPSPRSALRRGRATIIAIATATCFLTFAAASLAATGSVYVDGKFNVAAGHDFFGGSAPTNGSNVGLSYSVFPNLTTGLNNTAVGRAALRADTEGDLNTASGWFALAANTDGISNVATGGEALAANTSGGGNTASGVEALLSNTTGGGNTASGSEALRTNATGDDNTASGESALGENTTGSSNIAIGSGAGVNLTTGSDNVDIANEGVAGESKAIRIGTSGTQKRMFLAGVSGTTLSGSAQPVLVKANGQLGTATAASTLHDSTDHRTARRLKHQESQIRSQTNEIATLKREVAKLSRG